MLNTKTQLQNYMKNGTLKIRSLNKSNWGKVVILPSVGEVTLSEKGHVEVDPFLAKMLVEGSSNYVYLDGETESKSTTQEVETTKSKKTKKVEPVVEEEIEEGVEETKDSEDEATDEETAVEETESEVEEDKLDLESLTLKELIEVAKDAGIEESSYENFKKSKKLMLKFLEKSLKA